MYMYIWCDWYQLVNTSSSSSLDMLKLFQLIFKTLKLSKKVIKVKNHEEELQQTLVNPKTEDPVTWDWWDFMKMYIFP